MSTIKTLIEKLSPSTKHTLEAAANFCVSRGHFNIELEHWLHTYLQDESTPFYQMLVAADCQPSQCQQDINLRLEQLKDGNNQTPAISDRIISLIQEALLISALDYQGDVIDERMLLTALVKNSVLNQCLLAISDEFAKITEDNLSTILTTPKLSEKQPSNTKPKATSALGQFTINLNEQAKLGKLDEAIGRENEIQHIIDTLSRRRQNNAILTGEPGVGKTAIVEGLALRIVKNNVTKSLKNVVIHSLDLGLLQAGASVKGEFENRLKNLIKEIKSASQPIILFIDEAHTLVGAGAGAGQNDAANLLKPALARGELRCIAATTWSEYKQYFEKDAALTRRFQVVNVEEPSVNTAIRMLRSLQTSLEKHHHVSILDNAIRSATYLAHRYITGRQLPDKSISVLDTACARVASKQTSTPLQLEMNEQHLTQLRAEFEQLNKESWQGLNHKKQLKQLKADIKKTEDLLKSINDHWQTDKAIANDITASNQQLEQQLKDNANKTELKKTQNKLNQLHRKLYKKSEQPPLVQAQVDEHTVAEVIADWTGIPVGKMLADETLQLLNLNHTLNNNIIGQHQAVDTIADIIRTGKMRISNPNKPLACFLFIGPSGVGKTETAAILAETLYGDKNKMTVINMSEFKEAHKVSMLLGSPPGYVGYGEGGVLTEAVRRKPYSLILLDEMEKAHPEVQDVFYQIFDKGIVKDGQGRDINFKNTVIIMTSNACDHQISQLADKDPDDILQHIQPELIKTFKPAFLGRVTCIPYLPLNDETLTNITIIKIKQLVQRVQRQHQVQLGYTRKAINFITAQCQQNLLGARQIDNIFNNDIMPNIANLLLECIIERKKAKTITLDVKDDCYHFYLNEKRHEAA